ncbi:MULTISPECIES: hypothetical protein [unclassified Comamonas]|uniref:hypothetical protein n=1 Tax=unclassified Comamonas TaxID=2638500 RepID=UPI00095B36C8|nr:MULTISPECIES: hypothetical protein [unclassified Comamonas]MBN9329547.1 hypothetical protein [Comamonas sp.]OJW96055.1 MAG: hypothetical protein BGO73_15535 [Burkholderiales bacterium 66-26]
MGVLVDFLQYQHARLALELERLARQDAPLALTMIEVTRDADGRLGEPLAQLERQLRAAGFDLQP